MLTKTITYENADGKDVSEDFYFHLSKADLIEMYMLEDGNDVESRLKRIVASDNRQAIMAEFKKFIAMSVGYRTPEGKFVKTPEYTAQFMASEAYSELFVQLMTDTGEVTAFINGLMPKKLQQEVAAAMKGDGATVVELPNSGVVEGIQGDAEAQAAKPQPQFEQAASPTPFPQTLEVAVAANKAGNSPVPDDDPAWFTEGRYPTRQELMRMSQDEMQFAMKLKNTKAFG